MKKQLEKLEKQYILFLATVEIPGQKAPLRGLGVESPPLGGLGGGKARAFQRQRQALPPPPRGSGGEGVGGWGGWVLRKLAKPAGTQTILLGRLGVPAGFASFRSH